MCAFKILTKVRFITEMVESRPAAHYIEDQASAPARSPHTPGRIHGGGKWYQSLGLELNVLTLTCVN